MNIPSYSERVTRWLFVLVVVATGALLAGCGEETDSKQRTKAPSFELAATTSDNLQEANQDLAFRFLKSVDVAHEGNVVVSPLSLSMVMQMLANGADPGTDERLLEALGFSSKITVAESNAFNARLIKSLRDAQGAQFEIANAIWTAPEYEPRPSFVQVVERDFDGTSSALPSDAAAAADTINGWVDEHTAHRIEKIIAPDEIYPPDAARVMFLANALAFTGTWKDQFEKASSGPQAFYSPGTHVEVEMMRRTTPDEYTDFLEVPGKAGFRAVRLPYGKQGTWAAYVLVPNERDGLNAVIGSLTTKRWNDWVGRFEPTSVMLSMPKLDLRHQRDLLDDFKRLGIPSKSYNSLVTSSTNPIYIDFARQQAMLQVDEEGTKAAAATVVGVSEGAAMIIQSTDVIADHPYLFVLAERATGAIAMTAAVRDPNQHEVGL